MIAVLSFCYIGYVIETRLFFDIPAACTPRAPFLSSLASFC